MTSSLADTLEEAAALLRTYPSSTDALRALQGVVNSVTAAQAALVGEMTERGDHEAEGCSSVKNWLRSQLHVDSAEAHSLIHASRTLSALPKVADAADAGRISLTHIKSFTFALKHVGPGIVTDAENLLLEVALLAEPGALKTATRRLRDVAFPDRLDEAWLNGMDKHDIRLSAVGEGFHVTGFLPADTGAKFKALLESLSAPTCGEDDRPVAERRVTALDQLVTTVLNSGLPQDKGTRPHLNAVVDMTDLAENPDEATADLAGFGTIGPDLLQQLLCEAKLTPILTAGKHSVLDVGRNQRLATPKIRAAVVQRQAGRCAGPGCHGPVVHVHHVRYWSHGGETSLKNSIGLCPRCHSLVHLGRLHIDPETHETRPAVRYLRRRRLGAVERSG